jgi:hypothetical protein
VLGASAGHGALVAALAVRQGGSSAFYQRVWSCESDLRAGGGSDTVQRAHPCALRLL